ncbi:MAG: hypothetical protein KJT03_13605 [Verrucomicrobiae bacterium]|nr:hypothetical protein [Verrucomicrobiae bacterium]
MLPLFVGMFLAILVGLFATGIGLDRDRAFYPTVMIVIAFGYSLFAAKGESTHALIFESLVGLVFLAVTMIGFKGSLWFVAGALAAHGVFDFFHPSLISNPGVPRWWPGFCLAYDVAAAVYLAWLLKSGRIRAVV